MKIIGVYDVYDDKIIYQNDFPLNDVIKHASMIAKDLGYKLVKVETDNNQMYAIIDTYLSNENVNYILLHYGV